MKYIIFFSILSISLPIYASYSQNYIGDRQTNFSANSIFQVFPPNHPNKVPMLPGMPSDIRRELYDSISTGMSYEEVRAIIGWDGTVIYESEIDTPQGKVRERVYQWDSADLDRSNYNDLSSEYRSLYWSVTLQFQNDILLDKSALNLQPQQDYQF